MLQMVLSGMEGWMRKAVARRLPEPHMPPKASLNLLGPHFLQVLSWKLWLAHIVLNLPLF